ncbi:MAG: transposase, partial [Acidobacteriota bacterium]
KRFRKDKAELEKQIAKAETLVGKGEPGKRAKFVTRKDGKDAYVLDERLVAKTKLLLGLKGYHTNIPETRLSDQEIIDRYHDLWHVEQAFRMAKSDLVARPIFHHKAEAVRAHMVVCFVALAIGKHMEIATGLSLRRVMDGLWSVTDAAIIDTTTGEKFTLRSEPDEQTRKILKKLRLSY